MSLHQQNVLPALKTSHTAFLNNPAFLALPAYPKHTTYFTDLARIAHTR